VLLVDPVAVHLVRLADRLRWVTPNRITLFAFALGFGAAACLATATTPGLIAGALIYHLTFVLDCVDGKLARWQGSGSVVGGWLDFTLDQVRLVLCAIALLGGQYLATGRGVFLLLAVVVVFLNMFRYFDGFLMERALLDLRERVSPTPGGPRRTASIGDDELSTDAAPATPTATPTSALGRLSAWLTRRRIRMNVYSGIEFQMVVLIVAPLAGAVLTGGVLPVTIAACVIMVAFELAQITRFLRAAGKLQRLLAPAVPAAGLPPVEPVVGPAPASRGLTGTEVPDQRAAYSTTLRRPTQVPRTTPRTPKAESDPDSRPPQ
jgi:phosphatidylglycerophosphate synthase